MTREEKVQIVDELRDKMSRSDYFYITDASGMSVKQINDFRRKCFEKGVEYKVYKNTLIKKAVDAHYGEIAELDPALKGFSGVMFAPVESAKLPAQILRDFRKGGVERPKLKGACIDRAVFLGDDTIKQLSELKSKNELIGEIIGLLQSPAKTVISGLQASGGQKISGLLKALEARSAA